MERLGKLRTESNTTAVCLGLCWRAELALKWAVTGWKRCLKFAGVVFLVYACFWLYLNIYTNVQPPLTAVVPQNSPLLPNQDSSRHVLEAPPRLLDTETHSATPEAAQEPGISRQSLPLNSDGDGGIYSLRERPPRRVEEGGKKVTAGLLALLGPIHKNSERDNGHSLRREARSEEEGMGMLDLLAPKLENRQWNKDPETVEELFSNFRTREKAGKLVPSWHLGGLKRKAAPSLRYDPPGDFNILSPGQDTHKTHKKRNTFGSFVSSADSADSPLPVGGMGRNRVSQDKLKSWRITQDQRHRQMEEYCKRELPETASPSLLRPDLSISGKGLADIPGAILSASESTKDTSLLRAPIHSIVVPERDLLYCPVEKSASTFLRRFMYSLVRGNGSVRVLSPFAVPIRWALTLRFQSLKTSPMNRMPRMRLVVAREPFSRLFSAYVDKLLVPNAYYWKHWGKAITSRRLSPSSRAQLCGHDVTFQEFVRHVIGGLHAWDNHVRPLSQLCSPCAANFSLIAHLETLTSDFEQLTSQLNVTVDGFSPERMRDELALDALEDSTSSAFRFQTFLQDCVTRHESLQRLWLKLQLRGILDDRIAFPLTSQDADDVTLHGFLHILKKARQDSTDVSRLRAQKLQALKNAFAQVPTIHIAQLLKIYSADFDMFGYEKYPSFISRTTK